MKPQAIEDLSFSIIDAEAPAHDYDPATWSIIRRMIHSTADFDYASCVVVSPTAVTAGIQALQQGCTIITDTEMARMGIRKAPLKAFNSQVICRIQDPEVARIAEEKGITRAKAAVDQVADAYGTDIFVIGNAPTALLRIVELTAQGKLNPALVVGLPVGFVNAAESKAALRQTAIPHITNIGRKGGSPVAASVINALILLALGSTPHSGEMP
ncbi:MAG: precorrin-8X methylmutase [Deltaproteobacteria bacterium]|nr:MAG: precorrin-8X methylmutase [Deltaproteobacteria bacterium]